MPNVPQASDGGAVVAFVILVALSFLPSIVTHARGHRAQLAIVMMNLIGVGGLILGAFGAVAGFVPSTVIILVAAFIWALSPDTRNDELTSSGAPSRRPSIDAKAEWPA
jgi:hypothetical protein